MRKKIFWLIPTVIIIVLMFAFVHSLMKRNDNSLLPAGTENIENTTNTNKKIESNSSDTSSENSQSDDIEETIKNIDYSIDVDKDEGEASNTSDIIVDDTEPTEANNTEKKEGEVIPFGPNELELDLDLDDEESSN